MPLRLVDKLEKDVIDALPDEAAKVEKFVVYSMKDRFKEVAFPRIFGIKDVEELGIKESAYINDK
jgi:hypothetical protein